MSGINTLDVILGPLRENWTDIAIKLDVCAGPNAGKQLYVGPERLNTGLAKRMLEESQKFISTRQSLEFESFNAGLNVEDWSIGASEVQLRLHDHVIRTVLRNDHFRLISAETENSVSAGPERAEDVLDNELTPLFQYEDRRLYAKLSGGIMTAALSGRFGRFISPEIQVEPKEVQRAIAHMRHLALRATLESRFWLGPLRFDFLNDRDPEGEETHISLIAGTRWHPLEVGVMFVGGSLEVANVLEAFLKR